MKKILLMCLMALSLTALAQKNDPTNQIIGNWKFTNQSKINDFQKVFIGQLYCQTENFTFEPNNTFKHEFIDENGKLVKVLKGKWKFIGDKVKITYFGIDYIVITSYFFIDKDLVLGQNFSHVILTRENMDFQNVAAK